MKLNFKLKNKVNQQKGIVVIITLLTLGILLLLGAYFLSFTVSELKISQSQELGAKTYSLAEAGIAEAIWKLQHDSDWSINFTREPDCYDWQASFERENHLFPESSYSVSIENLECGRGIVTSIAKIFISEDKFSQRVIKVTLYKAIGEPIDIFGIFAGRTGPGTNIIAENGSEILVKDGNVFSGHNVIVEGDSFLEVEDKILAAHQIVEDGQVIALAKCAGNVCDPEELCEECPASRIDIPAIDFDSAENPNSLKSRAQTTQDNLECEVLGNDIVVSSKCVFTRAEFRNLLRDVGNNGTLTLNNSATYVTGRIDVPTERNLVVNGILAADSDISASENSKITVRDDDGNLAAGLFSKTRISFNENSQIDEFIGLLYALDHIKMESLTGEVKLRGAVMANNHVMFSGTKAEIILDSQVVNDVLYLTEHEDGDSPVIAIEHWEEAY